MATVRITPALRGTIHQALVAPYQQRIKSIVRNIEGDTQLGKLLYDESIPEDQAEKARLLHRANNSWVNVIDHIRVRLEIDLGETRRKLFTFTVKLPDGVTWPAPGDRTRWSGETRINSVRNSPSYQAIGSRIQEIMKLQTEEHEIVEELIGKIVDQCGSLRQVEKLWPSVLNYIDESTLSRYRAPSTRTTRKKQLEEIEVSDKAKHLLVKNRMIQNAQ